jgi:sugar phosphate isomerase/epimerase
VTAANPSEIQDAYAMKLFICTEVMGDLSFADMLDKCVKLGVEGVEMTGGGWSKGPQSRADRLLADKGAFNVET